PAAIPSFSREYAPAPIGEASSIEMRRSTAASLRSGLLLGKAEEGLSYLHLMSMLSFMIELDIAVLQVEQTGDTEDHVSLDSAAGCLNGVINEDNGFAFVLVDRVYPGLVTRVAFQRGSGVG